MKITSRLNCCPERIEDTEVRALLREEKEGRDDYETKDEDTGNKCGTVKGE